jgi:hypothetical protein
MRSRRANTYAKDASDETADVGPKCDAACGADLCQDTSELQEKPIDEHHPSRECKGREKESKWQKGKHADMWV